MTTTSPKKLSNLAKYMFMLSKIDIPLKHFISQMKNKTIICKINLNLFVKVLYLFLMLNFLSVFTLHDIVIVMTIPVYMV